MSKKKKLNYLAITRKISFLRRDGYLVITKKYIVITW